MKEGETYYLKKHHRPFVTSHPAGTMAVVDFIAGNVVHGYYPNVKGSMDRFICMKHEFTRIFIKTPLQMTKPNYDCIDNQRDLKKSGASKVTPEMKKRGSIKNRIPIQFDAKTTIFVHASKKNRIDEVVSRYEDRNNIERR